MYIRVIVLHWADESEVEALKLTLIYDVGDMVLTLHLKINLLCISAK
jgi:hypothetical protein